MKYEFVITSANKIGQRLCTIHPDLLRVKVEFLAWRR